MILILGESKTDSRQGWNEPSKRAKLLYPKGETVEKILSLPNKDHFDPNPPPLQARLDHMQLLEEFGGTHSMMYKALKAEFDPPPLAFMAEASAMPAEKLQEKLPDWVCHIFDHQGELIGDIPTNILQGDLKDYYKNHIEMDPEAAKELCLHSSQQGASQRWHDERKKRVTASRGHPMFRARKDDKRLEYFYKSPPPKLEALRQG
jgi:hypothetical protein